MKILTRVRINVVSARLFDLGQVLFDSCKFYDPTIKHFGRVLGQLAVGQLAVRTTGGRVLT